MDFQARIDHWIEQATIYRSRAFSAEARIKILECELDLMRKKVMELANERDEMEAKLNGRE